MLNKLLATVKKEALLLLRDKVGLAVLFVMPVALILVMTLIQDSAFKSINEKGIPIVFVNDDNDSLGYNIKQGLMQNDLCYLVDSIDGKPATAELAKKAVSEGNFLLGIVIPKGATTAIRKNVSALVDETMNGSDSLQQQQDSVEITILIDPVAKKSFLNAVTSNLREFISEVKTKIMFQSFSEQIADVIPDRQNAPTNSYKKSQIIHYKEIFASTASDKIIPNAVQHNVPAWTIFAMFFIAIPLSNSILKEKTEGSVFRLHTMPTPYLLLINGKIIVYVIVCLLQFLLMLAVGKFLLPQLGLPALVLGNSMAGILLLTLATGFAATGFGVAVGTLATTDHQAAIMGSLSILLLSALGGIWVPSYVMPQVMRTISSYSPLNWSLEGFYKLFLRGGTVNDILPDVLKLMAFFFVMMAIAHLANRKKRNV
ncbi:MAG: ABC transporter permease [Ferruginibacter sp.]|nr:ABC transporter permease [Bacteroidota bacterium]MBX2918401.1 ABC transporter permease [Ferruginibacter sp.]MCB0709935.1 ABC transporter permease [Chitinophagaceae bacterium]